MAASLQCTSVLQLVTTKRHSTEGRPLVGVVVSEQLANAYDWFGVNPTTALWQTASQARPRSPSRRSYEIS